MNNKCSPDKEIIQERALIKRADEIFNIGSRCLIITGGRSAEKSGALGELTAALKSRNIDFDIFDKIEPNPLTSTCMQAGKAARDLGADFIVGVGGGSPMDATKAAAVYSANSDLQPNDIYLDPASFNKPLPFILIGTTAGTGSEVTGISVLTNYITGKKKSISNCYAAVSVCDYRYSLTMPYSQTVSTALDAFLHAFESYMAVNSTEYSRREAVDGMLKLVEGLEYMNLNKKAPDNSVREEMYLGSICAGRAINITGTLFPHTVGYVLTEEREISHGRACAAFMPILIEKCVKHCKEKTEELEKCLNRSLASIEQTVTRLAEVNEVFTLEQARNIAYARQGAVIKNFINTPGGFSAEDEINALLSLSKQ